jgi:hypothetical protein
VMYITGLVIVSVYLVAVYRVWRGKAAAIYR